MLGEGVSGLVPYWFLRGDWEKAKQHVLTWLQHQGTGELVSWRYWAVGIFLARHDLSGAKAVLANSTPRTPEDDPPPYLYSQPVYNHAAHVLICMEAGQLDRARAWLKAADHWIEQRGLMPDRSLIPLLWGVWHWRSGNLQEAWQEGSRTIALAEEQHVPFGLLQAHRLLGYLAAAMGRPDQAASHLQTSLSLSERCRLPYEIARSHLARARCLSGAPGLREGLLEARVLLTQLGAARDLAQVEAALAALDAEPPAPAPSKLPDGLTEREIEVIRLVAGGLTDREIGAQLYISHRTVDAHLRNIFNKVGVQTRTALAAYAARHGLG